jgi:hypothetical protein
MPVTDGVALVAGEAQMALSKWLSTASVYIVREAERHNDTSPLKIWGARTPALSSRELTEAGAGWSWS